jgi:hypothetical protein
MGMAVAGAASATTFTVTNTSDSGAGSLRQAILDANFSFGNDDIAFAIPGPGVQTITLASGLPPITQPVLLDGFTQPGSSPNTNPVGQGLNAVLMIQIDGSGAVNEPCFQVFAGNDDLLVTAIQGLVVNRCLVGAIHVGTGGDGMVVAGNYLGTDPSGASVPGPQGFGVRIENALHVSIGGTSPFERNLISGHGDAGVVTNVAAFLSIRGNLIGTDAAGDAGVASDVFGDGLRLDVAASVTVGGTDPAARNVVSGILGAGIVVSNADASGAITGNLIGTDVTGTHAIGNADGISVESASPAITGNVISGNVTGIELEFSSSVIRGNFIGTDETASLELGNTGAGIYARTDNGHIVVGGDGPGEGNDIAHNGRVTGQLVLIAGGIHVRSPEVEIRANRIWDNLPLGIDLLDGRSSGTVTVNDPGDTDGGPNAGQNFPIITGVSFSTGQVQIFGYLDSVPSTAFVVDFFSDPVCTFRPWGYTQGKHYLGSAIETTDGSGHASFLETLPVEVEPGEGISATATDPLGRTSEFSQRLILDIDPHSGPPEGGTPVTITGMDFGAGTVVTAAGLPLTNVQVLDYATLTATMPALPAGSVYDIVLSNPPQGGYSLQSGWLSDFLDVPPAHAFHEYVVRVATNGISAGTGAGLFGVDNVTTRQQMAVFLVKAKRGWCYDPPPCTGVFADVPCSSPFAPWVEALAAEGITSGCGGGNFCPQSPVRRDQMAVFLLKALRGPEYLPLPCTGIFADVPCPSQFADWIETLYQANITGGCGPGLYCPAGNVTRGQMAVFVTRTFRLH